MNRICAGCGCFLGLKEPIADISVTHGLCDSCEIDALGGAGLLLCLSCDRRIPREEYDGSRVCALCRERGRNHVMMERIAIERERCEALWRLGDPR